MGLSAAAMCCYRKQARKFLSRLPGARSRTPRRARAGFCGRATPCHRAVAGPRMLGQQLRTPVCGIVFLRWWRKVTEIRLSRSRVRGRPERSSGDLTYRRPPKKNGR